MSVLIGVSSKFRAIHDDPSGALEPHEHEWEVTAWFDLPSDTDARFYRDWLDKTLSKLNGITLPPELRWSEHIAQAVGNWVNCFEVEVRRSDERIHAKWKWEEE